MLFFCFSQQESAKSQIRNILLQIPNYNLAYVAESCVKNKVLGIVRQLKLPINDSFQKDNTLSQADKAMVSDTVCCNINVYIAFVVRSSNSVTELCFIIHSLLLFTLSEIGD